MKKTLLKTDFIELRSQLYTYEEIVEELGISKPTAIKWAKEFAEEIEKRKINNMSTLIAGKIESNEDFIFQTLGQYNRLNRKEIKENRYRDFSKQAFNRLSKIINKRLVSMSIFIDKTSGKITNTTFVFKKEISLNVTNDRLNTIKRRVVFDNDIKDEE